MIESGRDWVLTHPMARIAVVALTLAFAAACQADAPAAGAAVPGARHHGPTRHLTVAQSIDANVGRLTRGLDLDSAQQVRLRQILVDQHRQIMQLRSGGSSGIGTILAIYDQTKARIRAMLNEEQTKKYSVDVSRDGLGPAQADLQHWIGIQDSKRQQDSEAPR